MKKISIVVPMYNESPMVQLFFEEINKVISSLPKYEFEIVAVNDGSKDNTLELLTAKQEEFPNLVIVDLSRNWGHESAVRAGLITATGDAIIPIDADLQDPPEIIPEMVKMWEDGYQVVNAKRGSRKLDSSFKKNTAGIYYRILNKLSGKVHIPNNVANFRLIDRQVLNEINGLHEVNRVFRIEVPYVGFKTGTIEFSRVARAKGESKYNLGMMFNLAISSIVGVSTRPLRWVLYLTAITYINFFILGVAELICYICYLNGYMGISPLGYGVWLIVNVMLLLFAILLTLMSINSLYLSEVVDESRHRPAVVINKVIRK